MLKCLSRLEISKSFVTENRIAIPRSIRISKDSAAAPPNREFAQVRGFRERITLDVSSLNVTSVVDRHANGT